MNDPQLALLIGRRSHQPQAGAADIARAYIELRAQQTELVLLAEREALDERAVALGGRRAPAEIAGPRLAATRARQMRVRADIVAWRGRLAMLAGAPVGTLDGMSGGPIPLPGAQPTAGETAAVGGPRARVALARYEARYRAAANAQRGVIDARATAAARAIGASAGTTDRGTAFDAERHALDLLEAEEQARAAMTEAFVELAQAMGLDRDPTPSR